MKTTKSTAMIVSIRKAEGTSRVLLCYT